jgi:hypothetical protein
MSQGVCINLHRAKPQRLSGGRIRPAFAQARALTDLHIHSTFSDGRLTIPEIVDLYGGRGFAAIAITDHLCETQSFLGRAARHLDRTLTPATFPIYREILAREAERAAREYGMLVVPGFELTKNTVSNRRSAHVLALGVDEWISADLSIEEICARIRRQGGLAIAAHPVSTRKFEKQTHYLWNRRREFAAHFDAWEVASGRKIFPEVLESGLPMIANSDLHRAEQLESWKTVFRAARGNADLRITFDEIRAGLSAQDLEFHYYSTVAQRESDFRRG